MSITIKKPWCIYKHPFLSIWRIGKVVKEFSDAICVNYAEEDEKSSYAWSKKYTERFETIGEAIKKYIKDTENSLEKIKQEYLLIFPSQKEELGKINQ